MQDTFITHCPTRTVVNRVEMISLYKMGLEYIPPPSQQMTTTCTTKLFSPQANSHDKSSYNDVHQNMITPS